MDEQTLNTGSWFPEKVYVVEDWVDSEPEFDDKKKGATVIAFLSGESDGLERADRELVGGIIKAIKYTLDDIALINLSKSSLRRYKHIQKALAPKALIVFGVTASEIGLNLNIDRYQVVSLQGCKLLLADSLHELRSTPAKKKALWSALQVMFDIS